MSSPIDPNSGLRPSQIGDSRRSTASSGNKSESSSSTASSASTADKVSLSATPEKLSAVRKAIEQTPEVDMERVEKIKEQIASGNYPIDADRIASKFIDLEHLLGE